MEARLKPTKTSTKSALSRRGRGLGRDEIIRRIEELEARSPLRSQRERNELGRLYAMLAEFLQTYD